ncbi:nidogen-2-like [Ciona intestinalis]
MKSIYRTAFLLASIAVAHAITAEDLYPFQTTEDRIIQRGDTYSSKKVDLIIPAKFYDTEYSSLWVNTDGFISFETDSSDVSNDDFPFKEALLAPYMANLDTTHVGAVYYQEHMSSDILSRATADVRRAFPVAAATFTAESVFVVTWNQVEGRSLEGDVATFTFQAILVSNGMDTYAIFLYPQKGMAVLREGVRPKSTVFKARAGFNQGNDDRYLEMYPVDSLIDFRNTWNNGEWIFQVGGDGVRRSRDVVPPELVRNVRQAGSIINVQDINLGGESPNYEDVSISNPQTHDYCARDPNACTAENSVCVNHDNGYCCKCQSTTYGNGKVCLIKDEPIRVNGNVTGTVDVRSPDGRINRVSVSNVDFHSYVITNQGRAYTAISDVSPMLGGALQPISAIGDIIGWLFAVTDDSTVNGFQYTGGSLQRRVSLTFSNSDYRFDMRQRFVGVTQMDGENVVVAHTNFVGSLPQIDEDAELTMADYTETYVKEAPGRISSSATRSYKVNNVTHTYDVSQTIIYSECQSALSNVPVNLQLEVTGNFLGYNANEEIVRYAMNNRVTSSGTGGGGSQAVHPCDNGNHDCHPNAQCEPRGGLEFSCRCARGFAGDGYVCDDFDECVSRPCAYGALCSNSIGSYSCECPAGQALNEDATECISVETTRDPCETPGLCLGGRCMSLGDTYRCICPDGYYFGQDGCRDLDECRENRHNCAVNAECMNNDGSFACICNPGYNGDGVTCQENIVIPPTTQRTACQAQYDEVEEYIRTHSNLQDGPEHPTCMPDGTFAPRQCNGFTQVCWCVDPDSGDQIPGTMTQPDQGYLLDCTVPIEQPERPPDDLTLCQADRWEAEQSKSRVTSTGETVFSPLCTAAGAYEPLQFHTEGYFTCVDFNGVEVSRHESQVDCLTQCKLEEYYAETDNLFAGTSKFVPQCDENGGFSSVQCDSASRTCYCVGQNGQEIPNTKITTDNPESITADRLECDRFNPSRVTTNAAAQLIYAQGMGVNSILLPVTADSSSRTLHSRYGRTAIGVAVDCANQNFYWTDAAGRSIFMAPISDPNSKRSFARTGIRSPEGIAVDFISGNVFWTDSGLDRIQVAKADGSNRAVLVSSGLVNPRGIAVDPFGGKMYWADWNRADPKIMVANMDGTNAEVFIREGLKLPNDITIDQFYRKLCLIDAGTKKIECMNLDGTQRSVMYDISRESGGTQEPFGLAVDGSMLYYTDRRGERVYAINTLNGERFSVVGPVGSHGNMYGISLVHSQCASGYNACSINNGGCAHLCIPIPNGRTCKCPANVPDCVEQ